MNKHNKTRATAVATLTAICMMAGIVRADDGGAEDHMVPAAYIPGDNGDNAGSDPVTCQALRDASWFNHELSRSDGEVSAAAPEVQCRPEIYAESTVDAD